jgi:FlaA1/EpsC-like NDP-sugar epimerase
MKKVLITGGTGTVGESFIKEYYNKYDFYTLSRNETKIAELNKKYPNVKTYVGDVINYEILSCIVQKIMPDIIIHAAALKHIDIAEKNPDAAILCNTIGSYNITKVSINNQVPLTIGVSTDKACDPKSVYGYTKKLMEELFFSLHTPKIKFICTRFANVAGSNGSVIPNWKDSIKLGKKLRLTDKSMNRLMFTKSSASRLIETAIKLSELDESKSFVLSKKMKSVNLYDLAKTMTSENNIEIVGMRAGEKLNEKLIGENEIEYTNCLDDYIAIYKDKDTSYKNLKNEYSSLTAEKATEKEILELINQEE